jgi:hypothetical protein
MALQYDGVTGIVFDLPATTFIDNPAPDVIAITRARGRVSTSGGCPRRPAA